MEASQQPIYNMILKILLIILECWKMEGQKCNLLCFLSPLTDSGNRKGVFILLPYHQYSWAVLLAFATYFIAISIMPTRTQRLRKHRFKMKWNVISLFPQAQWNSLLWVDHSVKSCSAALSSIFHWTIEFWEFFTFVLSRLFWF